MQGKSISYSLIRQGRKTPAIPLPAGQQTAQAQVPAVTFPQVSLFTHQPPRVERIHLGRFQEPRAYKNIAQQPGDTENLIKE
jgi:hypothetical protein